MQNDNPPLIRRISRSVTGHLRVAVIAVLFGMTAYGLVHILIWIVNMIENL